MKIALVTDSTADLPQQLINQWKIFVLPLKVSFGKEQYLDNELAAEEFYSRLRAESTLPTTSQPTPEDFASLYAKVLTDYDEIISIHISSGLSVLPIPPTWRRNHSGQVHVVDSRSISLGIGQQVVEAALGFKKALRPGCVESNKKSRENTETISP